METRGRADIEKRGAESGLEIGNWTPMHRDLRFAPRLEILGEISGRLLATNH